MKVRASIILFIVAILVATLRHDVYQVGLAVSSTMFCLWIALCFERKFARIVILVGGSITLAQISVLVRRAFLEEGLWATAKKNPFGLIVGDVIYGFKSIVLSLVSTIHAVIKAVGWSDYASIESLNYRFVVTAWLLVCLSVYLLMKKTEQVAPVKR